MAMTPKPPTLPIVNQTLSVFSSSAVAMVENQPAIALWYR